MRPTSGQREDDDVYRRGSLSDFSDYSSDEDTHNRASASTSGTYPQSRTYVSESDEEVDVRRNPKQALLDDEDPFADPFVDQDEEPGVSTPGISQKKLNNW